MSCLCFVCLYTYSLVRQVYMNNMVDVEAGAADHSVFWLGTMLLICLVVCVVFCFVLFCFVCFHSVSCVPYIAYVSGLHILDFRFGSL